MQQLALVKVKAVVELSPLNDCLIVVLKLFPAEVPIYGILIYPMKFPLLIGQRQLNQMHSHSMHHYFP